MLLDARMDTVVCIDALVLASQPFEAWAKTRADGGSSVAQDQLPLMTGCNFIKSHAIFADSGFESQ